MSTARIQLSAFMLLIVFSPPALALVAPAEVAVLPVIASGKVGSSDREQVESALRRALAARRYHLVDPAQIQRIYDLLPSVCNKRHCFDKIAGRLDATVKLQVSGRLFKRGAEWQLDLLMHDRQRQGQPAQIITAADRCKGCQAGEIGPFVERLVDQLFETSRAMGKPAYLEVRSTPPGATMLINNVPIGVTNMTVGVSPGRHTITLKKGGYKLSVHNVEVEPAARGKIVAELEKTIAAPLANDRLERPPGSSTRTYRWVLLGVAVASLGAGITLLALDSEGTCDLARFPQQARCPTNYATRGPGIAFTAAGGAAAIGSAILFYLTAHAKNKPKAEARALVFWTSLHAAGLTFRTSFSFGH